MLQRINNFFRKSQIGQGIVEYALILAFVIVVAAALIGNDGISKAVSDIFSKVKEILNNSSTTTTAAPTNP